jgi:hypothetical protein
MPRYLLVLIHLDMVGPLVRAASELVREEPSARFVVIVPTTPLSPIEYLAAPRSTATEWARLKVRRLREELGSGGVAVDAIRLGNMDPLQAVEDALRFSEYSAVIIGCAPHSMMHTLHWDLPARLARRFPNTPIITASRSADKPIPTAG